MFLKEVRWCGKIYDGAGVKQDPEKLQGLRDLRNPCKGGELQQFLCGLNWLRGSLPDYARVVRILQELLKVKLAGTPGTKRAARNMPSVLKQEQMDCFKMVKQLLMKSVKIHHLVDIAVVCLFTDASLYGWSVVITQVIDWDSALPVEKQAHQAIVFLSGCFSKAELN
uniref:AlNc14C142G7279 protein n=1 Tax=Albugo laibachii Nc14 TaxID=890382 RepID=F0WL90_9STRA|nr:AlNc14C142G7279 [Albugo laibachii Nc14]|eukprot:CCA22052.1 AlNc14C142G7279 [Albugo laibachii Nc14]